MKIIQTNSGLGHQELAFYLLTPNDKYLCIALNYNYSEEELFPSHSVGKFDVLEKYEIEPSNFKISQEDLNKVLGLMLQNNKLNIDFEELNNLIFSML